MKYHARPGARINHEQANRLGLFVETDCNGVGNPEVLVERAKDETCPIHDLFEWNDGIAAHQYRVYQARNYLGSIVIHSVFKLHLNAV